MVTRFTPSSAVLGDLDLCAVDDLGVEWILSDVKGWGSPSGTLSPVQRARANGATGGDSFLRPRPVVLSGACQAPTPLLASEAADRLTAAVALSDTVLTVSESGRDRWCTVRRDGEVLVTLVNDVAFEWSLQVVALDPRRFGLPVSASTSLPSSSGGLTYPALIPYAINAASVSGRVQLFNPGNVTGPVRLRIDGPTSGAPLTGPVVTHTGSGRSLVFATSLALGPGEFVTVDERHRVLAQGQVSRAGWVTSYGWPAFEPGRNEFAFTAVSGAGTMRIEADPAWL